MLTTLWFVRHAEADPLISDPPARPLTEKGRRDRLRVRDFFRDIPVDAIFSSPYCRAVETLRPLAEEKGLEIHTDMAFAEFHAGNIAPESAFLSYIEQCFSNPTLTRAGGESFSALFKRQDKALKRLLAAYAGKTLVIGTHGLALSALMRHYDAQFDLAACRDLLSRQPVLARLTFDGIFCAGLAVIDPLSPYPPDDFCAVETAPPGAMAGYRFVVILARHGDQWVFCRAKARPGYELPGGHIEGDETPEQAARRELYEETGARRFTLSLLCDYRVRLSHEYSNGQVFLSEIQEFSPLPDYEMASIHCFSSLPAPLRFPLIYPRLFTELARWREKGTPIPLLPTESPDS